MAMKSLRKQSKEIDHAPNIMLFASSEYSAIPALIRNSIRRCCFLALGGIYISVEYMPRHLYESAGVAAELK